MLIRLAARNLRRHLLRTALTGSAIAFGLAMMLFATNLNHGMHNEMIRTGVSQMAGHVVIQHPDYVSEREQDLLVPDAEAVAAQVRSLVPEAVVTRRAILGGLLNSTTNSVGVGLTAVDPGVEPQVTDWQDKLVEGTYLTGKKKDILLGKALADSLEVELGDKVVFMTQGPEEVESRLFRVAGIVSSGSTEADGFLGIIDIAAASAMLGNGAAHQVAIHLQDDGRTDSVRERVDAAIDDHAVLAWPEAIPEIAEFVRLDDKTNTIFLGIIGIMVAIGLLNTVLMSVMERIKEFGVLLAIGMSRRRLRNLVITEGVLLGIFGVGAGFVIGMLITAYLAVYGLDYGAMLGSETFDSNGVRISSTLYAEVNWPLTTLFCVGGLILTVLASIYPAWKAGQLEPVEAMRHV